MEQSNTPNPGKGMGTAGFVMALLAFIVGFIISGIAVLSAATTGGGMGLAIGWAVFSAVATLLSIMGMNKSKAAGHKAGLAMAGMIIGILAVLYSIYMCYAVHLAASMGNAVTNMLNNMGDTLHNMLDTMGH